MAYVLYSVSPVQQSGFLQLETAGKSTGISNNQHVMGLNWTEPSLSWWMVPVLRPGGFVSCSYA